MRPPCTAKALGAGFAIAHAILSEAPRSSLIPRHVVCGAHGVSGVTRERRPPQKQTPRKLKLPREG